MIGMVLMLFEELKIYKWNNFIPVQSYQLCISQQIRFAGLCFKCLHGIFLLENMMKRNCLQETI